MSYEYITDDNIESPFTYQYAQYRGNAFLNDYKTSRMEFINDNENISEIAEYDSCGNLLDAYADYMLKSFEIRKVFYTEYSGKGIPNKASNKYNYAEYLEFAQLMVKKYDKTHCLKYLNALLKINDTLLSVKDNLSKHQKNLLANSIKRECEYVSTLVDTYENLLRTQNEFLDNSISLDMHHKVNEFSLLCANTSRSKAYIQILSKFGIILNRCYIMTKDIDSLLLERDMFNDEDSNECQYFNLNEPLLYSLQKYGIEYKVIDSDDINSNEVLSTLSDIPEKYLIYSGKGGQILKPQLFQIGKEFIHAHAGMVPEYRGSTTIYYEMLDTGRCSVSVMMLNEELDKGDVLGKFNYQVPQNVDNIDTLFEPYLRAISIGHVISDFLGKGEFTREEQNPNGNTYYVIHPVLKHIVLLNQEKGKRVE